MKEYKAIVITPVKNSLENTLRTIETVKSSSANLLHFVYDDFSEDQISAELAEKAMSLGYEYIHVSTLTDTPSPNYFSVLKDAQHKCLDKCLPLIIVESDVEVQEDTLEKLLKFAQEHITVGLVGAVTVDYNNNVNYPYLKFKNKKKAPMATDRSLSFCCTLLTYDFLKVYNFENMKQGKDWFDTTISHAALEQGFQNYVLLDTPVLHKPHGSRPWKQLKYTNPIKYYWFKFTQGRDKI